MVLIKHTLRFGAGDIVLDYILKSIIVKWCFLTGI